MKIVTLEDWRHGSESRYLKEFHHLSMTINAICVLVIKFLLVQISETVVVVSCFQDLDILYEQQSKALQDPVAFVEKLQNNVKRTFCVLGYGRFQCL